VTARCAAEVDRVVSDGGDPGRLAGVPVAIKDNLCTRGIPTTCSSRILEGWRPPYDATVVTRLAAAGAVMVGKTNLDEFAMGSSTENLCAPSQPPTIHVPGGPGGRRCRRRRLQPDLVLRQAPSASPPRCAGIRRPTYGRSSVSAWSPRLLDQVVRPTVADAAAGEVIGGTRTDLHPLPFPWPAPTSTTASRLHRATEMRLPTWPPGPAVEALTAAAVVEEVSVPAVTFGLSAYYLVAPAEASSNLSRYDGVRYGLRVDAPTTGEMMELTRTAGFGDEVKRRIMLGTYALSAGYYDAFYNTALKVRTLIRADFEAAYERFDALLSPTSPTTAFELGAKTEDPMAMYLNDVCTIATNLAGHPAMSVPYGVGDDGLPVGVQVLAPTLGEVPMFRVAAALEGSLA
jgi:aspartyl-tRNA(Asn)/glutamyl-tRNA(Gln) amidotransferase subunit A